MRNYYPPRGYAPPPPGYGPPPCYVVTPGPLSEAAQGPRGALIGAIAGNAGRGAGGSAPPSAGSAAPSVVAPHAAWGPATDGGWSRSIRNQPQFEKRRAMKTKVAPAPFLLAVAGCAQQP